MKMEPQDAQNAYDQQIILDLLRRPPEDTLMYYIALQEEIELLQAIKELIEEGRMGASLMPGYVNPDPERLPPLDDYLLRLTTEPDFHEASGSSPGSGA